MTVAAFCASATDVKPMAANATAAFQVVAIVSPTECAKRAAGWRLRVLLGSGSDCADYGSALAAGRSQNARRLLKARGAGLALGSP